MRKNTGKNNSFAHFFVFRVVKRKNENEVRFNGSIASARLKIWDRLLYLTEFRYYSLMDVLECI